MRISVKSAFLFLGLLLVFQIGEAFEVSNLETPESFIVDPKTGDYYISNIKGRPTDKDSNGFITKVNKTGKVTALKFVGGDGEKGATLHAPKGLAIIGNVLYVSDIDVVLGFDKATGTLLYTIDLKGVGALFLNDLTHDEQEILYVADAASFVDSKALGTIFKIETKKQHKVSIFIRDVALGMPSGLVIHPKTKRLLVSTWNEGKILEVGPDRSIKIFVVDAAWKNLSGLDSDSHGNLYTSSYSRGEVYSISPNMKIQTLKSGLTTPSGVKLDRKENRLLMPSFHGNLATTIDVAR